MWRTHDRARTICLCVLGLALTATGCSGQVPDTGSPIPAGGYDVVARVDGHPVVREEVAQLAGLPSRETSADRMPAAAVEAAVRVKAIQLEAHRRGLVDAVDLADLVTQMADTNRENAAVNRSGGVTYGVSSFDVATYLARSVSTTRAALFNAMLASGELEPTGRQLRALYDSEREGLAAQPDTVVLDLVRLESSATGVEAAQDVVGAFRSGDTAEAATAGHEDVVLDVTVLEVTPESAYELSKYQGSLYSAAMGLRPGGVATVTDDLAGGVVVLRCRDRTANEPLTFKEATDLLRARAQEELFERRVDDLVAAADTRRP